MVGGDLYWFWKPYELYGMVDYVRAPVSSGFFSNHGIIMHLGLRHPSLGGWRWLRQCRRYVPSLVENIRFRSPILSDFKPLGDIRKRGSSSKRPLLAETVYRSATWSAHTFTRREPL
jgi:hypothetical protein